MATTSTARGRSPMTSTATGTSQQQSCPASMPTMRSWRRNAEEEEEEEEVSADEDEETSVYRPLLPESSEQQQQQQQQHRTSWDETAGPWQSPRGTARRRSYVTIYEPRYTPIDLVASATSYAPSRDTNALPSRRVDDAGATATRAAAASSTTEIAGRTPFHEPVSDAEFSRMVECVKTAIRADIYPEINGQGSSGSYFCRAYQPLSDEARTEYIMRGDPLPPLRTRVAGIFKPKDEEPYGQLNPKWTKWLHRNCFPCFFGRGCLIPNLGYLSEAAAFLLDQRLGLNIVPRTGIVQLASPSFHYGKARRKLAGRAGGEEGYDILPEKIGSFQLFVDGYEDAGRFFSRYPWTEHDADAASDAGPFRWTPRFINHPAADRGMDNWMIKWCMDSDASSPTNEKEEKAPHAGMPHLHIAAIDNGLAFPWKHPDQWRSYPYGWLSLPVSLIERPFSAYTRQTLLPKLTSSRWWQRTSRMLYELFRHDEDFNEQMFARQLSVIKGQAWNLVECLRDPTKGPVHLCDQTAVVVIEEKEEVEARSPGLGGSGDGGDGGATTAARAGMLARLYRSRRSMQNLRRAASIRSQRSRRSMRTASEQEPTSAQHTAAEASQRPRYRLRVRERLKFLTRIRPCFTWC
ncbi:phosphatidylinositol 3 and 4-kinase-domain-containing protein [Syncephalis pseudoplumigaleata]|uniref:Phosphatidylinositol 4-kinase n=1 Tax=Syncephalis pseudoplumigaleata TaxID=1712513 RepID=A0A4P9Z7C9_9FUNG|nr:phosphatidylinositol 3 and 4-kinase-domain-containing protein [Syncephalis pseudoplumigaleata]|eukprot:RKP28102.1 phosphatidylinositol 3 and 4-kinase-domain-containing protein [Syncephalis pseudoplumigaleata]